MTGRRVGVFGIGRSGLAVARAALRHGATPIVFDEKPPEVMKNRASLDQLSELGIESKMGWSGSFCEARLDMLVTSPGVPMRHPKLQGAQECGIEIVSEIEWAYRISKAPIVAITGTNGKSTTTVMTWLCLRSAGEEAVLCGNIFGSGYEEVPLTEAALGAREEQVLVAEVSSFQLEWVREFAPAVAGITNITPDHLDRYESFEEYAEVKQRIFARQTQADFAVVRSGDPVVRNPATPRLLTFGEQGEARVEAEDLVLFEERVGWRDLPIEGGHNRTNAAMACLMAHGFLTWKSERSSAKRNPKSISAILDGLKQFRGLAHRMERVGQKNGVLVINNSMCTNPAAVVSSASSISGRKHLLIGGSNKKLEFDSLRKHLESTEDRAYLYGRDAGEVNAQLGGSHPLFSTMWEAFAASTRAAQPGEIIMLAPGCASQDQFEDFRDRGNVFREIAKEWLDS